MSDASTPMEDGQDTQSTGGQTSSLSVSDRFDLLANARRRAVLRYLMEHQQKKVRVEDIAQCLLTEDFGNDLQNVILALEHIHLPKFAHAGVVEYDSRSRHVRYHEHPELERLLTFVTADN